MDLTPEEKATLEKLLQIGSELIERVFAVRAQAETLECSSETIKGEKDAALIAAARAEAFGEVPHWLKKATGK
jgi:hypothetical protein